MTTPEQGRGPDGDGWISWDGGSCPVAPGTVVEIRLRNGDQDAGHPAIRYDWGLSRRLRDFDIIAYRVVEPAPPSPAAVEHVERGEEDLLRGEIERLTKLLALASRFNITDRISVESRGHGKWAVSSGASVLADDGLFEYEPFPSSRDDEFLARTRFTFEEAMERARTVTRNGEV